MPIMLSVSQTLSCSLYGFCDESFKGDFRMVWATNRLVVAT